MIHELRHRHRHAHLVLASALPLVLAVTLGYRSSNPRPPSESFEYFYDENDYGDYHEAGAEPNQHKRVVTYYYGSQESEITVNYLIEDMEKYLPQIEEDKPFTRQLAVHLNCNLGSIPPDLLIYLIPPRDNSPQDGISDQAILLGALNAAGAYRFKIPHVGPVRFYSPALGISVFELAGQSELIE